ncbi:MAG: type I DNA topoisomerase [Defluviitaleaceae bacterium]|nr:type I DNA topoisomerase [Defluviitaleaceae bacterium]
MADNLVIVESPAKAKTLKKFLGSNYKVEASVGHVRDLPKSDMGIDFDNDFEPKYITIRGKGEILATLRKEVKNAKKVYIATDPDREGEAISWHLYHALKLQDKNTGRISFNEITKDAVKKSIKQARDIDMDLVDAQQARRILDRIVGYKISPLLWKKVKRRLSAGRVQSATMKMICDREEEIEHFIPEEYWTVSAKLQDGKSKFEVKLATIDGKKAELKSKAEVDKLLAKIKKEEFVVDEIKTGTKTRKPSPPFTTSTLQQEASKALGFATNKTMQIAQQLYEGVDVKGEGTLGLVSYIRTDSVRVSDEAFLEAKTFIENNFGSEYAVKEKIEYKQRGRSQDAHESIRPTYTRLTPVIIKDSLSRDQFRLYKLIWERFVACQMESAVFETLGVKIAAGNAAFRASGSTLKFPGYLAVYKSTEDEEDDTSKLPELKEGKKLKAVSIDGTQHFTQPPPRYSDASLVKSLEELGIGRPSTYSAIITTILHRGYVVKENKVFYPTELGEIVNEIMENNFGDIVDIDFTAKIENDLDRIEDGDLEWKELIRKFYAEFLPKIIEAEEKVGEITIEDEKTDILCDNCGANMVIKHGKFGKFLACPSFPDCRNTKPFFEEADVNCPKCSGKILIKKTKKGRRYYGCENTPDCDFMSWNKPAGEDCPLCGAYMVEKGSKTKKVVCSDSTCGYSKEFVDKNDEEATVHNLS